MEKWLILVENSRGVCGKIWVPMWKTMLTKNMEIVTKLLKKCNKYYKNITNITKNRISVTGNLQILQKC